MQLATLVTMVQAYQEHLGYDFNYPTEEARMQHIKELHTALNQEVAEFLDWLPWKNWRPVADQKMNVPEAALELIDITFFTVDLWLALGLQPEEFESLFKYKLAENMRRIDCGYNKTTETSKQEELDL